MFPRQARHTEQALSGKYLAHVAAVLTITAFFVSPPCAIAQFVSGSNGSDGAYSPAANGFFKPGDFHGTGVANNVFNFTTITIPKGVTITFSAWYDNQPVYFLATGDVDIEGTLNLLGALGNDSSADPLQRIPAQAGAGGYGGGVGGDPGQPATAGFGPGGGAAGTCGRGNYGTFTSNDILIPLRGGSGGGGVTSNSSGLFGAGGGAGGGAILIASSTRILVSGTINASGGQGGGGGCPSGSPAGGSGGAIRLVADAISGGGEVYADPSSGLSNPGRVRLEAYDFSGMGFNFHNTPKTQGPPLNNFYQVSIPTSPQPSLHVTSINGQAITENPFGFPNITINTSQPVPVVITGHQVPIGTVPTINILGETSDQDSLQCPGGMQGTLATSTCSFNAVFPFGGSRGLVWVTWQNSTSQK